MRATGSSASSASSGAAGVPENVRRLLLEESGDWSPWDLTAFILDETTHANVDAVVTLIPAWLHNSFLRLSTTVFPHCTPRPPQEALDAVAGWVARHTF